MSSSSSNENQAAKQQFFHLPLTAQAMDIYPHAIWALTDDKQRTLVAAPFAHCRWHVPQENAAFWVSGFVRRENIVDYVELADPLVAASEIGAGWLLGAVADSSVKALAILARHRANVRAEWPLAVVVPMADLLDGRSVSMALHCDSPTALCACALIYANAPAALLRLVLRLSTLLSIDAQPPLAFADVAVCVRSDAAYSAAMARHTDSALATVGGRIPFLDVPLTDLGGILTCVTVPDLVRLLALLAVFKYDALAFTARIVVRGADVSQIGIVVAQLLALTQSTLPFAGSTGLLVNDDDVARGLGLSLPGLFGIPSALFATARAVLAKTNKPDVVETLLADLVVLDLDQRTLSVPPRFTPFMLLPNASNLIAEIAAVLGGANSAVLGHSLTMSRTIQLQIANFTTNLLHNAMHLAQYVDLAKGTFASEAYCAGHTDGALDRLSSTAVFRKALAHSPLLDHYVMREIIMVRMAAQMESGDSASFRQLWLELGKRDPRAKAVIYATRLRDNRLTLLHLAYEYFKAGNAAEYATSTSFVDVLVNWAGDVTRIKIMKERDLEERMPLYYLCRARPAQLAEHADKLRVLLAEPVPEGTKSSDVDNPAKLLATPFYAVYRGWDNVTLLMSGVKNETADITVVLLEALGRVPLYLALEVVAAATHSGGKSALHSACDGGGNAGAVKAILQSVRAWCTTMGIDGNERVLALLSAKNVVDGRTPLHMACRLRSGAVLLEMIAQLGVVRSSSAAHAKGVRALLQLRSIPARGLSEVTALEDAEDRHNEAIGALRDFSNANDA
jgi:hypothetical protein